MVLSPQVCYVCGGPGAVQSLPSRSPGKNGSYFPFLESHEAPNGSRPPTKDGVVDACNICYAFLQQQWESYEKIRTPLVKRLYWLKRLDNRPFTGAEMRLQGEYAAQVMGLQYYPSNTGTMSPYEYSPIDAQKDKQQKSDCSMSSAGRAESPGNAAAETRQAQDQYDEDETGALDLSLTSSKDDSLSENKGRDTPNQDKFTCFTCKCACDINHRRIVNSACVKVGEPHFSFLVQLEQGAQKGKLKNAYYVCRFCQDSMYEQWKIFEYKKLPEHMRNYCIKNEPVFRGKDSRKTHDGIGKNMNISSASSGGMNYSDVCYLCGQCNNRSAMKMLNVHAPQEKSSKHSMFFPCIKELIKPTNAKPFDQYGRVISCRACYSYLQRQWQSYQQDNIPTERRNYVFRPSTDPDDRSVNEIAVKKESKESMMHTPLNVTNPLNIEINSSSSSTSRSGSADLKMINENSRFGLLAIAPHIPAPLMVPPGMYDPGNLLYGAYKSVYPDMHGSSSSARNEGVTAPDERYKTNSVDIKKEEGIFSVSEMRGVEKRFSNDDLESSSRERQENDEHQDSVSMDMYNGKQQQQQHQRLSQQQPHHPDQDYHRSNSTSTSISRGVTPTSPRSSSRNSVTPHVPRPCDSRASSYSGGEGSDTHSVTSGERSHQNSNYNSSSPTGMAGSAGGGKPPPLNMLNANIPRTTATVQPMNVVSPGTSINSTTTLSAAARQQQQQQQQQQQHSSSFAAALRKLAKQAEGPESSPIDHTTSAPESANTSPRESESGHQPTPTGIKHRPGPGAPQSSMSYAAHHPLGGSSGMNPVSAPPVVTIAPTSSHSGYLGADGRKNADRTSSSAILDPLGIKPERDKMITPHERNREDESPRSKDSSNLPSRMTPHQVLPSVSSASSLHEDPSRGFQPYRSMQPGEDPLRHGLPFGLGIDSAAYSAYAQAAATAAALAAGYQPTSPYGAQLRMDDPMLLERYRLMQSSYPAYAPSQLMPPPGLSQYLNAAAAAAGRYPQELLSQMGAYSYMYSGGKMPEHLSPGALERLKSEEELRHEREREAAEREREKEREQRREKEERERAAEQRERERERERMEKERQIKEAERRHNTGGSGGGFSTERMLAGSAYPHAPPPAHEPLNLKRSGRGDAEDDHHHPAAPNHQRVAPMVHRQLNGEREQQDRLLSYRQDLSSSSRGGSNSDTSSTRTGIPTLGVPPLGSKSHSSSQSTSGKDNHHRSGSSTATSAETHHPFHRPFELPGLSTSSSSRSGGDHHISASAAVAGLPPLSLPPPPPPMSNGYERDSVHAEYERRLLMEREKMLAEHRAAQEKLQQRTNATSSGNSSSSGSNRDSSQDSSRGGGNHTDSKHRGSYEGKEGIPRGGGGEHASSSKTLNLSSSSSHQHSQHHHSQHHSHHPDSKHHHSSSSSSSSSLLSPYKSLPSQKSSTNTSASSSNNNNTKFPPSPHRHLLQQYPPYSGKDAQGSSKSLESSHQQALTRQSHSQSTVDSTGGKSHPAMFNTGSTGGNSSGSSSQSALTSLQNFSNSKVPSSFGSIIHSADLDERKLKDSSGGNMLNNGRINGSFQSRLHSESAASLELFNKRKDASLQQPQQQQHHHHHHHHHGKGHNVRSPKRVRHLLTGSHGLAKEKLEDGEPLAKQPHLGDFDSFTMAAQRDIRADDLNREPDYRQKACFLFSLELEPVPPEKRKVKEFCQKVCEWDKLRRQAWTASNPQPPCHADNLTVPYQYTAAKLSQMVSEAVLVDKNTKNSMISSNSNNQSLKSTKSQQQHATIATPVTTPVSGTNTNSNTQPFLQASATPAPTRSVIYNSTPGSSSTVMPGSGLGIEGKPMLSHHFAQEFHESVLKETQQQRANKAYNSRHEKSQQDVRYTLISENDEPVQSKPASSSSTTSTSTSNKSPALHPRLSHQPPQQLGEGNLPSSLQSMQIMASQLGDSSSTHNLMTSSLSATHHKAMTSPHGSQHSTVSDAGEEQLQMTGGFFRWPGVEAIMLAYQKHVEEVNTEKQILQEQCTTLKSKQRQMSKSAEEMKARMTELRQNQHKMEDERTKYQNQLDHLRKLFLSLNR